MKKTFKKITSFILAFVLAFGMCSVAFATSGNLIKTTNQKAAVPDGFTPVYTAEDLNNIRNNLSGKYILMNHINLSDYSEWNAIGNYDSPFEGELNGNGYSIIGLNSKRSLLGCVENATIKNLGIVNCNIFQPEKTASSSSTAGSFANNAINSSFEQCYASGTIQACVRVGLFALVSSCSAGGLAGVSKNCSFVNCYNYANIHFTYDKISSAEIGGLVGDSYNSSFEYCYNTGNISSENKNKFDSESSNVKKGGLVGSADNATLFNCCYYKDALSFAAGKQQINPAGTRNLTETEIKSKESYIGFDFNNIWKMSDKSPILMINKAFINDEINLIFKTSQSMFESGNTKILSWETSDNNIAIINEVGEVEGVGVGNATIYVETADGQSKSIVVNVSYTFWQKIIILFFGWLLVLNGGEFK